MSDHDYSEMALERVFERQRQIRFIDIGEIFIARVLLGLVDKPLEEKTVTVEFNLAHLFTRLPSSAAVEAEANVNFELSHRIVEEVSDALNAIFGLSLTPRRVRQRAFDHYAEVLHTRLSFLRDGDEVGLPPVIDMFEEIAVGQFLVSFQTRQLIEILSSGIEKRLELHAEIFSKLKAKIPSTGAKIDYRKELDLLQEFLNARQEVTGEIEFDFTSKEMPFRHAVLADGNLAMPSPGTCGPSDRLLLPLYLEATGLLDITHIGLCSPPSSPNDIVVKFTVRRPAKLSLFGVLSQGLTAKKRRNLNEIQLSVYDRVHTNLQKRFVFTGRPLLEQTFAEISLWALQKLSYSLAEPSFLGRPALKWLADHATESYKKMEDDFFLPILYERLYDCFGDRLKKKPEMFGGEIDILLDNIPIELKVRRGESMPLSEVIDAAYRPASQASAYAALTRLAIVFVLDLPEKANKLSNLDSCIRVIERNMVDDFPTCVVVFIFHCHHPKPSLVA